MTPADTTPPAADHPSGAAVSFTAAASTDGVASSAADRSSAPVTPAATPASPSAAAGPVGTSLPAPDRAAADAFWAAYATAHPDVVRVAPDYTVESFGDSPRLADALLREVTHGAKRATAELATAFHADGDQLPRIGSHWIACDGRGHPAIIMRSTELRLATFNEVDEAFAFDEGEDDRTLASWRREHRRYWERTCAARGVEWSEDDEIVLERFRVVWPPEFAD